MLRAITSVDHQGYEFGVFSLPPKIILNRLKVGLSRCCFSVGAEKFGVPVGKRESIFEVLDGIFREKKIEAFKLVLRSFLSGVHPDSDDIKAWGKDPPMCCGDKEIMYHRACACRKYSIPRLDHIAALFNDIRVIDPGIKGAQVYVEGNFELSDGSQGVPTTDVLDREIVD